MTSHDGTAGVILCVVCGDEVVKIEVDRESWWVHRATGQRISHKVEEHYASTYRHDPQARQRDPDTSHQAADSVDRIRAADLREYILDRLLHLGPQSDETLYAEAVWEFGDAVTPSGLRTRRSELVKEGKVEYAGYTTTLRSGRQGRVWRLVEKPSLF